jgi:hypothetical protein
MELAYRIRAAEPHPEKRRCKACGAAFSFTEARVLRIAKNPKAGNRQTPQLCWICAHLHLAAHRPDPIDAIAIQGSFNA